MFCEVAGLSGQQGHWRDSSDGGRAVVQMIFRGLKEGDVLVFWHSQLPQTQGRRLARVKVICGGDRNDADVERGELKLVAGCVGMAWMAKKDKVWG